MNPSGILFDTPRIETPRLILRKIELADAPDMFLYASDPEVTRYVLWPTHTSMDDSIRFIRYVMSRYERHEPADWAIELKDSGHMIGTIGFVWINSHHRNAEAGYVLSRTHWRRGYATEALRAILEYAFQTLELHRVEANHKSDNDASGRVMEKCGMQFEGLLREKLYAKGSFWDLKLRAVLRRDFLQTQKN